MGSCRFRLVFDSFSSRCRDRYGKVDDKNPSMSDRFMENRPSMSAFLCE